MRLIDADVLMLYLNDIYFRNSPNGNSWRETLEMKQYREGVCEGLEMAMKSVEEAPTVNGWISVKDRLPEEHDSMFAQFYGTSKWNSAMWRTESDRVLVAILFPDGTRTVDKGKLQDGEWRTGVARVLPQKVTHWAVWPEPPKEE